MRKLIIFGLLLIAIPVFAETAKLQTSDGTAVSSANPLPVTVISGGSSGAPTDATFVTQTANATLSAEQALSSLSTGIARIATTTGVITTLTDSAGILANISDETGTGVMVFSTTPTLVTPVLGTATATQITVPTIIGSTSTTGDLNLQTTSGVGATGADMHFLVGNAGATEAMTILNSGNVGLGTTNPATALDVAGASTYRNSSTWTASVGPTVTVTDTSTPDTATFSCTNNSCQLGTSTNTSLFLVEQTGTRMTLHNNGNVGIGTTVPAAHFSVGTTSQLQVDSSGNTTTSGTIISSRATDVGWSVVNGTNTACNTTCTNACVVGIDVLGTGGFLLCTDASADSCLCAGGS